MSLAGRAGLTHSVELDVTERDYLAARLRARSLTYAQIGEQLGVTRQAAQLMVTRAMGANPRDDLEVARQLELDKIDALEQKTLEILERKHFVVAASGKVAYLYEEGSTPQALEDDSVALKAVETLAKLATRRSKLLGLDEVRPQLIGLVNVNADEARTKVLESLQALNG